MSERMCEAYRGYERKRRWDDRLDESGTRH